jgi:hypothetical protein
MLTETYSNLSRVTYTMAESSNSVTPDLNQDSQSASQDADSVGKSFLRNVREKWSKVPQGWAQKRTNSSAPPVQEDTQSHLSGESTGSGDDDVSRGSVEDSDSSE